MSYTVLARRYRSKEFDELIGQEPIARTLQNAISAGRTAHAYLFCGTRGVGKTSLARLFAKALNVPTELAQAREIGEAIMRGDDLDVIEIDGASNRGIQEAKDLIAGSGLSPARSPYKIYIIDEVHMLTREAFNALLKTMEEPPSHVKFILCTTEAHKVPATIQSRCQRFDFRAIPTREIAGQLRTILTAEGIEADEEVVVQVARLGHGSMRDALSLLDRLIASGESPLTLERVEPLLGLPDQTLVVSIMEAVIAGDAKAALEAGAELLARGTGVEQALDMITEHLRTLMLVAACGADSGVLEVSAEALRTAEAQASHFDVPALVYLIALCDATSRSSRAAASARALFDATLVRMCLSERLADVAALLAEPARALAAAGGKKKGEVSARPAPAPAPAPAPTPAPTPPAPTPAPTPATPTPARLVEPKEAPAPAAAPEAEALWPRVVAFAAATSADQARVQHLAFRSFDGRRLRLAVEGAPADSARYFATQADNIADLVKRATGQMVVVTLDAPDRESAAPAAPASGAAAEAQRLPLVQRAMDIFDASVVEVTDESTEAG